MPPSTVTWPLDPHTNGKHLVLTKYMQAWLPIMTRWNARVLFVDGFAGPGEYSRGEPGSPLIVLDALSSHSFRDAMTGKIHFLFIERDEARAKHLKSTIESRDFDLPAGCSYSVVTSPFNDAMSTALDLVDGGGIRLPPAFIMIDPFGVAGLEMATLTRVLQHNRTEVYISFMYDAMNRFISLKEFEPHLDDLFASTDWRTARNIADSDERRRFLFGLFTRQLKNAGAEYVVHFELYEGARLVYAIFFGSNSLDGCDKMKQAIWSVTTATPYRFRSADHQQLPFGDDLTDFSTLEEEVRAEFGSRGTVSIEDVTKFVMSDKTNFHTGHLKRKTLAPMEKRGELTVISSPRKRKGSFPDGTTVSFGPH